MEYIKKWIEKLDELQPDPTDIEPKLTAMPGLKAVIFDIYGTLLISASGDIDQASISADNLKTALLESGYELLNHQSSESENLQFLLGQFVDVIRQHHMKHRDAGRLYPEVDIRLVWEDMIDMALKKKMISKTRNSNPDKLTFIFELLSNKVHPMPGMKDILQQLNKNEYHLGIISNAQFYTPVLMNFFLTGKVEEKETIKYFDPALTVFSFIQLNAKPDLTLFKPVLKTLKEKYGVLPEQSVFVGNDVFKDLFPAKELGMKTVLFAGDKRSLRFRKEKKELEGFQPDAIITELNQLKKILNV